jgi:peptide/nickel transport system permease protein
MQRYIITRIIQAIITALILATAVFVLVRMSGTPLTWLINPRAPEVQRQMIAAHYGLDKPLIVQYWRYLVNIIHGDFGQSYVYNKSALSVIWSRVPATLELTGFAVLISVIIGIPIGVYSAVKRGKFIDVAGRIFAFLGISAPSFWVGLMCLYLFGVKWGILPIGGRGGIDHLILPALVLSWGLAAGIVRLARSGMMDVINSDYITMARAKGVSEQMIIWKHAFRNACIPVVTMIMILMIVVLSGDVVLENIFSWAGLGQLIMTSTLSRDYPIVQAFTLIISFTFVVISLLADILYAYLNPRVRYR